MAATQISERGFQHQQFSRLRAMQKSPHRSCSGTISYRHLLVLVYLLVLGLLVALISNEKRRTSMPVSVTHATYQKIRSSTALLSLHGERMHDGARILRAADVADDRPIQFEILPGVSVRAIAVKEQFALVGCFKNKLVSVDLSTRGGPTLLGSLELPGYISEITVVGRRALVGMARNGGMAIVDFSQPEDLQLQAHFPSEGSIVDMVAVGDQVYFADIYRGLGSVSMVGKNSPPKILDAMDSPWRIAVSGDRMVVATLHGSLVFFDLSRGEEIKRVGTMDFPDLDKGGIRGLAFSAESLAVALSDGSVRIFPLSYWPALHDYSNLKIPGVPYKMQPVPGQERLAISLVSAGVVLVDVHIPDKAYVSGHLMMPMTNVAMDVEDDVIYASRQGRRQGLVALGLARIEQSSYSPATYVDHNYHAFYAWNGRLFGYRRDKSLVPLGDEGHYGTSVSGPILLVHDEDGVTLFRMSGDGEVSRAGSLVMEDGTLDAVYAEGALYVLHRGGLRVFSGPQLEEMLVCGEMDISGRPVHLRYLEPGYLLVTTSKEGLKVLDISDRKHPVQVAQVRPLEHLQSSNIALDILVNDSFAYISHGSGGLYVIDIGDPRHPELVQVVDTPGMARKMALHDDLLLVADGDEGLYMIDAGIPGRLLPVGSLPTPLRVNEIATVTDGIVVSNYPGGTLKLPFPERLENYRVVSAELLQSEAPASGAGGYVYLYDARSRYRVPIEPPAN